MLSVQEIQDILSDFGNQENLNPVEKKKNLLAMGNFDKDKLLWFKNPMANENDQDNSSKPYYAAQVVKVNGSKLVLTLTPEEIKECKVKELLASSFEIEVDHVMEYSKVTEKGIADMVEIDELNHATLLHNLYSRYCKDDIYTYVGPILLAMNPFKNMEHYYTKEIVTEYQKIITSKQPLEDKKSKPPHIFTITAMAFKQMMENKKKQAIVISGESGAGKTESAKRAMKFLTSLGAKPHESNEPGIEQKILDTNPVLEAFGNAKTVRNNNSSRFGKYVILYFDNQRGDILGARVKNYLLEKSRVVGPAAQERNYHVFYHILRGASDELLRKLGLFDNSRRKRMVYQDFAYLKTGADVDQTIVNDEQLFKELSHQFQDLGFSQDEILGVWKIVAACLHIGELQFDDSTYDENGKPCSILNIDKLAMVSMLLGIDSKTLEQEIVNKPAGPGQTVRAPYKILECADTKDSLAKQLFDNLFSWLVERMNLTILPEGHDTDAFLQDTKTIGLLDIFGFENFKENNFEQLCINYVNEKLHKLYISAIFDAEKIELKNEGLEHKISELKYPDLTALVVIKLLDERMVTGKGKDSKNGIFNIVNDCSTQKPRPDWKALLKKIEDAHKTNNKYGMVKNSEKFKISHSAKEVIYTVSSFIDRNVDEISSSLDACIKTKADQFVSQIYSGNVNNAFGSPKNKKEESKGPVKKTIWTKFSVQMQDLMNELAEPLLELSQAKIEESKGGDASPKKGPAGKAPAGIECEECELHFIRCIKPNDFKIKDCFIHAMCLQQITYMGVLESIDLKQKNYPFRKNFEEFYQRFEILGPLFGTCRYEHMPKNSDFKQYGSEILKSTMQGLGSELYAVGNTKILLRNEIVAVLEKAKAKARKKRDDASMHIKRSFALFLGFAGNRKDKFKLQGLQTQIRSSYNELINKRAKQFYDKAMQSIIKYKTEKRKDKESKAALVVEDTYKKHMFRKQLARSIRERQKVIKSLATFSLCIRLRKLFICHNAAQAIVERAFKIGKQRQEQRSVRNVQRIFRGFQERHKKMKLVLASIEAKENLKLHVAAKKVQKQLRGRIVRKRLQYLNYQAQKVQAFMRMKWYSNLYQNIKKNAITIQRGVRRFLARRDIIKDRLYTFLSQEVSVLNNVKQIEHYQLFGNYIGESGNQVQNFEQMNQIKVHTPYSIKKISLFTKVIDLNIMTDISEIYNTPWANQWGKISKECLIGEAPVMSLNVGQSHSLAINLKAKIYCWGWNDNGQCANRQLQNIVINSGAGQGQVPLDQIYNIENMRVKQAVTANDRTLVLLQDSQDVFVWGGNDKGQLGLGTYHDQYKPKRLDFFYKQNLKVCSISASGDLNFAATENGEAYAWPFYKNGVIFSIPVRMPFSEKVKIARTACGQNFGFFISTQGLVYSLGKDNSEGQLGLGHTYPRDVPELITSLKDVGERIDYLECGYKHVIAKSTLGKIFTWGWGGKGQLGHGHFDSEMSPRYLMIEKNKQKEKVIQIAAGYSHTVVMIENGREILMAGTSGMIQNQPRLQQFRLSAILPELFPENTLNMLTGVSPDFAVVKVQVSWSKTMSVTSITVADLRAINSIHSLSKIQSSLQSLASKWDPREVMPPYIDTISGLFGVNLMKIPYQQTGKTKNEKSGMNKTTSKGMNEMDFNKKKSYK